MSPLSGPRTATPRHQTAFTQQIGRTNTYWIYSYDTRASDAPGIVSIEFIHMSTQIVKLIVMVI